MNYLLALTAAAGFFAAFLILIDRETARRDNRTKAAADALYRAAEPALYRAYNRRR